MITSLLRSHFVFGARLAPYLFMSFLYFLPSIFFSFMGIWGRA